MNQTKKISVKITRAEIRGRKIIIVIEPDLFSGEEFAIPNTWSSNRVRESLKDTVFTIQVREKDGQIEHSEAWYAGAHYTRKHTQISTPSHYFISDEDSAFNWVETCPPAGLGGDAVRTILSQWEDQPEVRDRLAKAIKDRQERNANEYFQNATEEFKTALDKYQSIVSHRAAVKS